MSEFAEKQIKKIQYTALNAKAALLEFKLRIKELAKSFFYWSSVVAVGFVLTGVIAQSFGVDIFPIAYAGMPDFILQFVGNLLYYAVFGVVLLAALVAAYILEVVLLYPYGDPFIFPAWNGNGFVNVEQVVIGWKLVRDICNIFFSIILVIIALASVLKIEAYSWKQLLPKFFIAAILINFSKSIAGVFTDLATVAMATFGSSFSGTFARGLIGAFGLPAIGDIAQNTGNDSTANIENSGIASVLFAYVAAAAMAGVFFIIMLVFAATLVFRIIMLWFLIVLSPLAYITRILPLTQRYSSQWWEMFGRYCLVGPLVTFFLWLALTMAYGGNSSGVTNVGQGFNNTNPITQGVSSAATQSAQTAGITQPPSTGNFQATNPNVLANFMVSTLMLLGALKLINQMAQEFGRVTGAIEAKAGSMVSRFAEKAGQAGVMGFSKWGTKPYYDDETGQLKRGTAGYYIGQGFAALSSTIGQPLSFARSVAENVTKSSDAKQEASRTQAMLNAANLRNEQVLGRNDGAGSLLGALSNIAGTVTGAGMKDGKVVWDNYFSPGGIWRGIQKGMRVRGDMRLAEDKRRQADQLEKSIATEKGKLSKEEVGMAEEHYADAKTRAANAEAQSKLLSGIDTFDSNGAVQDAALNGALLDTTNGGVRVFLEGHINDMAGDVTRLRAVGRNDEADDLEQQMATLQGIINAGGTIGAGELLNDIAGLASVKGGIRDANTRQAIVRNLKKGLEQALSETATAAKTERDAVKRGLENTGYIFDQATGDIATKGSNFRLDDKIDRETREHYTAERHAERLEMELAALAGDSGYETYRAEQEAIGEALRSLDGVYQSNQLIERMLMAKRAGDIHGMRAAWMRLQQNNDLNEITQRLMSVDERGVYNDRAGTGAESLWHAIDTMFSNADDRTKREIFDRTTSEAAGHGNFDRAFGSMWLGGRIRRLPEEDRRSFTISQASKMGAAKLAGLGRFAFFREDAMGNPVVYDDKNVHIGPSLLIRNSEELKNPLAFNRFHAASLRGITEEKVIRQMVADGNHEEFTARLRQWRKQAALDNPSGRRPSPGASPFARYEK